MTLEDSKSESFLKQIELKMKRICISHGGKKSEGSFPLLKADTEQLSSEAQPTNRREFLSRKISSGYIVDMWRCD